MNRFFVVFIGLAVVAFAAGRDIPVFDEGEVFTPCKISYIDFHTFGSIA